MHSRWVLTWSADTLDVKLHICMIKLIIKELKKAVLVDNCCTTPTPDPFCGHTEMELGSSFPYELLVQPHAAPTGVWKFVSCLFGDELTYGWDLSGYWPTTTTRISCCPGQLLPQTICSSATQLLCNGASKPPTPNPFRSKQCQTLQFSQRDDAVHRSTRCVREALQESLVLLSGFAASSN